MSTRRIDIVHTRDRWVALGRKHRELDSDDSKGDLVERTVKGVRKKGETTLLRIHKRNGHLQEERFYPHTTPAAKGSTKGAANGGKGTGKKATKGKATKAKGTKGASGTEAGRKGAAVKGSAGRSGTKARA